jgi:hypothetical protein
MFVFSSVCFYPRVHFLSCLVQDTMCAATNKRRITVDDLLELVNSSRGLGSTPFSSHACVYSL